jgi:hypothetical protein
MSGVSGLETRRLHALAQEETIDRLAMDAKHATDPNRVEPPVVNEAADRLGMDAELACDLAHAHQPSPISVYRRHNPP